MHKRLSVVGSMLEILYNFKIHPLNDVKAVSRQYFNIVGNHEFPIAEASWDLIVVSLYLQRDLFESIKRGLKPGGVALVIVLLMEPGHERSLFRAQPGELAKYFEGWEISHYYEGRSPDHHGAVAEIVATKR